MEFRRRRSSRTSKRALRFRHLPPRVKPAILQVDRRPSDKLVPANVVVVHDVDLIDANTNTTTTSRRRTTTQQEKQERHEKGLHGPSA